MTNTEFKHYKTISDKVLDLLINEKLSSLSDIKIIYNIIMGFPYCLNEDSSYTYNGEFYDSFEKLPDNAKRELLKYKES